MRGLLNRMLRWHIVLRLDRPVDMGILDSHLEKLLEKDLFRLYQATYPDAQYPHIRNAFDAAARLWHEVGNRIAEKRGFEYPHETEQRMLAFIHNLGDLK